LSLAFHSGLRVQPPLLRLLHQPRRGYPDRALPGERGSRPGGFYVR
jgi:hypothetical protein